MGHVWAGERLFCTAASRAKREGVRRDEGREAALWRVCFGNRARLQVSSKHPPAVLDDDASPCLPCLVSCTIIVLNTHHKMLVRVPLLLHAISST